MGNFVKLNTALPTPKVDANPPRGLPNELDAADINNLWNALADLRAGLIGPDAIYKLVATGAISRTIFAKLADLISINDFGIGDPSAVLNILENGRVSQLPYIDPYAWWRPELLAGYGIQPATAFVGEKQEPVAINRTTTGTVVVAGVETTGAANTLRFQDNPPGLLIEQARTQFISTPDAPVNQAGLALPVANYYLRVEGSGSITVALATGTATGLPLTVTASTPGGFAVTVAATVNTTVTGSVTFAQLENGQAPTSRIHTALAKTADTITLTGVLRNARDWVVSVRAQPNYGLPWGPGNDDRGLFTIGDSNGQTNSANAYYGKDGFLHMQITDAATANRTMAGASVFLGTVEHEFWFSGSTDGIMDAWIDGQRVAFTVTGVGTGIIGTMPTNLRPCSVPAFAWINGVCKDFKIYFDTTPARLPQPQWVRTITPNTVACIGDSITFGLHQTVPWPSLMQTTLSGGTTGAWTVLNAGVSGDTTWQMISRWGAGVRRQTQKYVVAFAGTNDFNAGLQEPEAWANLTKISTQVRTDGKTLILVTTLPRTAFTTAQNAERVKYNTLIRAYCAAGNAILVDADPVFDNGDGRTLKVAYDFDGTHINDAGAAVMAALVAAAIPH